VNNDPAMLWNVSTGHPAASFTAGDATNVIAFGSDAETLATGGEDGTVRLWDIPA
jgi:FOG: WD40 repeat